MVKLSIPTRDSLVMASEDKGKVEEKGKGHPELSGRRNETDVTTSKNGKNGIDNIGYERDEDENQNGKRGKLNYSFTQGRITHFTHRSIKTWDKAILMKLRNV